MTLPTLPTRHPDQDAVRHPTPIPAPVRQLVIKRRGYRPGDHAAPYAGPNPIEQSQRIAEAEAAARRASEQQQPEEKDE